MSEDTNRVMDRDRMKALAAEIAERIVGAGGGPIFPARRVCPPNRLCCWAGYTCSPPFYCDDYFGCIDRFTGLSAGGIVPAEASEHRTNTEGNHGRQR